VKYASASPVGSYTRFAHTAIFNCIQNPRQSPQQAGVPETQPTA
jgi:hypothetical protein